MAAQGQSGYTSSADEGAYTATGDLGTTNLSVDTPADSPYITAAGGTTLPWSATLTNSSTGASASVDVTAERIWGWDYLWQPIATLNDISLLQSAEADVVGSGGGYSVVEPPAVLPAERVRGLEFHGRELAELDRLPERRRGE